MVRPHVLAALAPIVLVACAHTEAVGGFELDRPKGWKSESGGETLIVHERDVAWVWAFSVQDAAILQGYEGGLTDACRMVAKGLATREGGEGSSFDEPVEFDLGEGIVAVSITGQGKVEGVDAGIRVVIVVAGGEALTGIGYRRPGTGVGEDAEAEGLIRSIRLR